MLDTHVYRYIYIWQLSWSRHKTRMDRTLSSDCKTMTQTKKKINRS